MLYLLILNVKIVLIPCKWFPYSSFEKKYHICENFLPQYKTQGFITIFTYILYVYLECSKMRTTKQRYKQQRITTSEITGFVAPCNRHIT